MSLPVVDIGNAKVAGLTSDLHLDSAQFSWVLTAYYISYLGFQWLSFLYNIYPAHIHVSVCVVLWGLVASTQCLATSYVQLILLRACLGVAEAGFGPGCPVLLSFFFRREELGARVGLFICSAPLASACASSLAWAITALAEGGPIAPWRLLFLVEGFPTILAGVVTWHLLPDSPSAAKFWGKDSREMKIAVLRLEEKQEAATSEQLRGGGINWRDIGQTLMEPKCYVTAVRHPNGVSLHYELPC